MLIGVTMWRQGNQSEWGVGLEANLTERCASGRRGKRRLSELGAFTSGQHGEAGWKGRCREDEFVALRQGIMNSPAVYLSSGHVGEGGNGRNLCLVGIVA